MEEPRKGAAPNSGSKVTKSASLDEDFGKDFLTSWKSTKFDNDAMDFDVETSEGKGSGKKFNFGKLDDFDLDADFDKLPSFKMDMSDLDFSIPVKKNSTKPSVEKSLKDSSHGKDKEQEPFAFSFNFDDLGKFDLDSDLAIKKKETPQLEASTSDELGFNKSQKGDLPTEIIGFPKIGLTKTPSKPEASSSTSAPSTEKQTSKLPSYELSNGSDQVTKRRFSVPSISGSSKHREAQVAQSHSVKGNFGNKTDSSQQSQESDPQLIRTASPVSSSNNQDCVTGACSSDRGLSKQNDSTILSVQNKSESKSERKLVVVKEVQVEEEIHSTPTTSTTQRLASKTTTTTTSAAERHLEMHTTQEKAISSLLYKPQPKSALTSEQDGDSNPKTKLLNPDSEGTERQSNDSHAKSSLIIATEKTSKTKASVFKANEKSKINCTLSTLKNTNGCLPADNAPLQSEKQKFIPNSLTSRLTTMTQISPTSESDLRSVKLKEMNKAPSQLQTDVLPNSASKRKPALLSPSLKRKAVEDSVPDPFTPLKRISNSLAEARKSPIVVLKPICNSPLQARKSSEIALRSGTQMITRRESAEALPDNLKSPDCTTQTVLGIADFEIPVLTLENNGNVEKAETISRELGDISSMLKKKQHEAKELLVRAILSNNKLLVLNHPIYAEKLSSLEKFASTLRAKYF